MVRPFSGVAVLVLVLFASLTVKAEVERRVTDEDGNKKVGMIDNDEPLQEDERLFQDSLLGKESSRSFMIEDFCWCFLVP